MQKLYKYGIFSGPYFSVFGLNTEKYGPKKKSVFGHFLLNNTLFEPMGLFSRGLIHGLLYICVSEWSGLICNDEAYT